MNAIEKIITKLQLLLAKEELILVKDAAGIIDPKGIDSKIRTQAIKDCISIVNKELNNDI